MRESSSGFPLASADFTIDSSCIHATVVGYDHAGLMILGPTGIGKSRLAADIIQRGGQLVADDQVQLAVTHHKLVARAAPELAGVLELHGMGLIRFEEVVPAHLVHLVLELAADAPDVKLPEPAFHHYKGINVPYIRLAPPVEVASLLLYLRAVYEGRVLPTDWRPKKAS